MYTYLRKAITDTTSRQYVLLGDLLAVLTILSTITLVLETVPSLHKYNVYFLVVEWVAVGFFTLEYGLRTYFSKRWHDYTFSFFGIVDLLSIVPTYLGVGNLTFLKSARILRIVRFLRMLRLAKMARVSGRDLDESMDLYALNVAIFVVTLFSALILVGVLMYVVEGGNQNYGSIPLSMLWAFKVFLLGIPIALPETTGGQIVHMFARFVGLIVFGVLVGILGNIFKKVLLGKGD